MKKLFLLTAAFATMLFASCEKEEMAPVAKETTVTYTVELPSVQTKAGTKAIGDGFNVDQLVYEVWKTEVKGERDLKNPAKATRLYQETVSMSKTDGEQKCVVTLNLVHDQNYTILFWAQNDAADAYNTDVLTNVTYAKDKYLSNNENMAAFYGVEFLEAEEIEKSGPMRRTELKRPFAQLNIATMNTVDANEYKVQLNTSKVKFTKVPTVFDVAQNTPTTPAVTGDVEFTFDYAALPEEVLSVNGKAYDHYVAMNYIFAPNGEGDVTVEYWIDATLIPTDVATNSSTPATINNTVINVPLKENYRTNIVGNLLTSTTQYEVVIDARWDDVNDPNLNGDGYVGYYVYTTEELATAVAEAHNGATIYIADEVVMPYFTNKALNFVGVKDKGVVRQSPAAHNNDFYYGAELNFTNLTLVGTSYTNNTQGYQKARKETYNKCTFIDYHMFAGEETIVDECTFTGDKGQYFWTGIAKNITFNKCKFNNKDRAVKVCTVGNNGERTVTFNDCNFRATSKNKTAIEIDGTKGSSYTVNINNCTATGFAANDNTAETLFNIEGTENVTVFVNGDKWLSVGTYQKPDGTLYYTNSIGLNAAIANAEDGETLLLAARKFDGLFHVGSKSIKFASLDENNRAEVAGRISVAGNANSTFTCENIKLSVSDNTANGVFGNTYYDKGKGYIIGIYCGNVVVRNCAFSGMTDDNGAITYHSYVSGATTENLEKLTVEGCTFDGGRAIRARSNVSVTNSTFRGLVNPCLQILGLGDNDIQSNVVFTGNTSNIPVCGVCIKTSGYEAKNINFNVSGNTNCNVIAFDGKNLNNLFPDTYTFTGEVTELCPEDGNALKMYLSDNSINTINLVPGCEYDLDAVCYLNRPVTINGNASNKPIVKGKIVANNTFKAYNVKFESNNISANSLNTSTYGGRVNGSYAAIVTINKAASTFEGCEFVNLLVNHKSAAINYSQAAEGKVLTVKGCKFEGKTKAIYTRALCEITGCTFDLEGGSPVYVWPTSKNFQNNVCTFKNNYAETKAYSKLGFLTGENSDVKFANIIFDVQGNTGEYGYNYAWANGARCATDGSVRFAEGSKVFNINADGTIY